MNAARGVSRWVACAAIALSLAACGDRMADLKRYVAQVKARKVTKIPPIPQIVAYKPYRYLVANRRDPFEPQAGATAPASAGKGTLRPDINRPKEPLEAFPLDSLSMVGVIDFKGAAYAMVSAPDGVIHRVTVGNHMGQNYGKVVKITSNEIDLIEIVPNGFGGWEKRPATLSLAE